MIAATKHDHILDVPFYSQFGDNGLDPFWQERSCGILALKMVIDYWRLKTGQHPVPVTEIFNEGNVVGGRTSRGDWVHSALVMVARHYGFTAWRRGWMLSSDGTVRFSAEGADEATLAQIDRQQRKESFATLIETLQRGYPVIVSVAKNFDEIDKPHVVVLTGLRRDEAKDSYEGFYYNDPNSPDVQSGKNSFVALAEFTHKWRYQGIFVIPAGEIL